METQRSNSGSTTQPSAIEMMMRRYANGGSLVDAPPEEVSETAGREIAAEPVAETHPPTNEAPVVYVGSTPSLKSEGLRRRENAVRRIKIASGVGASALVLGGTLVATSYSSGGGEVGVPFVASIGSNSSVIDDGHEVGAMPRDQFVITDLEADTPLYLEVTANEKDKPDVTTTITLSDRPDLTGDNSVLPGVYLFSREPFSDDKEDTVARAPLARIKNNIGFRLTNDGGGTSIERVAGKSNTVQVSRDQYGVETFIPNVGDPGAPEDAFVGYESRLDRKMFKKDYVSSEAFEAYASTIDGDRSTKKVVDANPILLNGHRVKVLEDIVDTDCYADVRQQLDDGLTSFVEAELKKEKGKDVEVVLVGAYKQPADMYRQVLGDDQPQVDGAGDESLFTGDFVFGESTISCDNAHVSDVFDAYRKTDKSGKEH